MSIRSNIRQGLLCAEVTSSIPVNGMREANEAPCNQISGLLYVRGGDDTPAKTNPAEAEVSHHASYNCPVKDSI